MVRWIAGIIIAFLLIDHVWVHYGSPIIDRWRGEYREELKKATNEKEIVPIEQAYRKSLLDELWEKVKGFIKRDKDTQGEGG